MRVRLVLLLLGLGLGLGGCRLVSSDGLTFHCESSGTCPAGSTCCADGFCRASCPPPSSCDGGSSCDSNPGAPCVSGRLQCDDGGVACVDEAPVRDGTSCGASRICRSGQCELCVNGVSCRTNPTPCLAGALQCVPTTACLDTVVQLPAGEPCGVGMVCSPAAVCNPCASGGSCTGNPTICRTGVWSCTSGEPRCVDGPLSRPGTRCGTDQVCDAVGACIECVQGQSCQGNPTSCRSGGLDCTVAPPVCVDTAGNRDAGTPCGANRVCNTAGACVDCTPGQTCTSNPTRCRVGITTCSSGAFECIDTSAQAPPGSSCGTNRVCSASGTCVPCTEGEPCTGNPTVCKRGVTQCGSGAPVCVDGTANANNGTPCGNGQTCNSGFCGTCVQGQSCTGNPTACRNGAFDCTGSSPGCVDAPGSRDAGTPCGVNQVCDSAGACVSCTASQPCDRNPNPCKVGVTTCASGAPTCTDSAANTGQGTLCPGGFCDGTGACVPCALNTACTSNPGAPCRTGVFAQNGATCACIDSGNATQPLPCGTTTTGAWGTCSYASACSHSGSRTRTVTTYTCSNGTCAQSNTTETDTAGCARNQQGQICGARNCPPTWPACTYANPECSNTGTRSRTCTTPTCSANETCSSTRTDVEFDNTACNRNQNGQSCGGGYTCNPWPDCNSAYSDVCDTSATITRACTDRRCGNGTCNPSTVNENDTCNRSTDGNACPGGVCAASACCTGCISGGVCEGGHDDNACGRAGEAGRRCIQPKYYCETGQCCDRAQGC